MITLQIQDTAKKLKLPFLWGKKKIVFIYKSLTKSIIVPGPGEYLHPSEFGIYISKKAFKDQLIEKKY